MGFSPSAAWPNAYEWPIKGMDRDGSSGITYAPTKKKL